jgi:hypothetical protein
MAPVTEFEEASGGGENSIMLFAAVAALLTVFVLAFGLDVFHLGGQRSVAKPPESSTQAPTSTQP